MFTGHSTQTRTSMATSLQKNDDQADLSHHLLLPSSRVTYYTITLALSSAV